MKAAKSKREEWERREGKRRTDDRKHKCEREKERIDMERKKNNVEVDMSGGEMVWTVRKRNI